MLYGIGANGNHQLGLGNHARDISTLESAEFAVDLDINEIYSGGNHSLFLTSKGHLYGAGLNSHHQLGIQSHDGSEHIVQPVQIPGNYQMAAAGWEISFVVDTSGVLYSSGFGAKGELGLGGPIEVSGFTKVPDIPGQIIDIKTGLNHVVILFSDGSVYGWGSSRKGQLGAHLIESKVVTSPTLVYKGDIKISHICCGKDYTVLGNSESGIVDILGADKLAVKQQMPVEPIAIRQLGSGWSSIHILSKDGKIYSWGNNSHGQLESPTGRNIHVTAIGSEHGLAHDEHSVYGWGWGEHGNCGEQGLKENKCCKLEIPGITDIDDFKVKIFAGHANSWIQILH